MSNLAQIEAPHVQMTGVMLAWIHMPSGIGTLGL